MDFMEWNQQTLGFLSQNFLDTLSSEPETRRNAEKNLSDASVNPNYGISVLRLVATPAINVRIRQCAAVNFKNHVIAHWKPSSGTPISDDEKMLIRQLIVPLLSFDDWNSTPIMHLELREAINVLATLDHPKYMEASFPQLKLRLKKAVKANDYASVNDILTTVASFCVKFRKHTMCDRVMPYVNHMLDNFAKPLLTTVKSVSVKISDASAAKSVPDLRQLIETQKLCCEIFYSLNCLCIPECFEENADKWMSEFKRYITVRYPFFEDCSADGVSLVDELRVIAFDNVSLYMEKDEEQFEKYLGGFVEPVVSLLVDASAFPKRENLIVTAIKFLTNISMSAHHALFSGDEMLQKIIEKIVVPNAMLRDEDEELFKTNYVKYIKKDLEGRFCRGVPCIQDLEGSDHTRRSISCFILKGLAQNYKQEVTEKISEQISYLLAKFAENPDANWKYKACAIHLVIDLTALSRDLVDIVGFFTSVIIPELHDEDVNAFPLLKAGALKFFTVIWLEISKPADMVLLGDVVGFLVSNVNAVRSYAACCLSKLLLVKVNTVLTRFTSADIVPILPVMLKNLFDALEKPESEVNKYIILAILRAFQIADISPEVASNCITRLTPVLNRVCENPKNSVFNHCLFEAIATLVTRACEKNPCLIPNFESWLLPIIQMIQAKEVSKLFPNSLQLGAQLIDLQPRPISPQYMFLFDMLSTPVLWRKSAYVPGLVRLLQSFLQRESNELNRKERLENFLKILNKLVSSPSTEEDGFHILNTLIKNLKYNGLKEVMNHIWPSVFPRLQNGKNHTLVKCLIIFMSLFLVKHGMRTLEGSMNSAKENSFRRILCQFWIPNLKTVAGSEKVNMCAVASTKLLCESPLLLDPAAKELWGKLLDGIVSILPHPEEEKAVDEIELFLFSTHEKRDDPLKEISDPNHYLVTLLTNLCSKFPGRFRPIIIKYLSSANQVALLEQCFAYDLRIV